MNQTQIQEVSLAESSQNLDKNTESDNQDGKKSNMYYKGGFVGAAITAFASWNAGKYTRIGHFIRRWKFIRYFIDIKPNSNLSLLTNYHRPNLDVNANNFYCYSGQSGIGKSFHFKDLAYKQSLVRPTLYVSFKSIGRQVNFENDLAEQLKFGQDGSGIIGQIIRAVRKIKHIRQNPLKFQLKYLIAQTLLSGIYIQTYHANLNPYVSALLYAGTFLTQLYYFRFMGPIVKQWERRTLPVIIFDDVNKIQQMNMLAQIVRFLKIIQDQASNIILVSSDQETWSNLRRQPGMKDRLRIRNMKYDHIQTANKMISLLHNDFNHFKLNMTPNPILDAQILKGMINILIGQRQMSIRRFESLIKLVDQEEYQVYINILRNPSKLSISQLLEQFKEFFLDFQAQAMVISLKTIKRQLSNMSQAEYFTNLDLLLKKQTLSSDNKIAPNLKLYNIVRDLKSQYIITGRYTYIVFQMALSKYKQDMVEYQQKGQKNEP